MFYLELSTGLRRGELVALPWRDLNFQTKTLTVYVETSVLIFYKYFAVVKRQSHPLTQIVTQVCAKACGRSGQNLTKFCIFR